MDPTAYPPAGPVVAGRERLGAPAVLPPPPRARAPANTARMTLRALVAVGSVSIFSLAFVGIAYHDAAGAQLSTVVLPTAQYGHTPVLAELSYALQHATVPVICAHWEVLARMLSATGPCAPQMAPTMFCLTRASAAARIAGLACDFTLISLDASHNALDAAFTGASALLRGAGNFGAVACYANTALSFAALEITGIAVLYTEGTPLCAPARAFGVTRGALIASALGGAGAVPLAGAVATSALTIAAIGAAPDLSISHIAYCAYNLASVAANNRRANFLTCMSAASRAAFRCRALASSFLSLDFTSADAAVSSLLICGKNPPDLYAAATEMLSTGLFADAIPAGERRGLAKIITLKGLMGGETTSLLEAHGLPFGIASDIGRAINALLPRKLLIQAVSGASTASRLFGVFGEMVVRTDIVGAADRERSAVSTLLSSGTSLIAQAALVATRLACVQGIPRASAIAHLLNDGVELDRAELLVGAAGAATVRVPALPMLFLHDEICFEVANANMELATRLLRAVARDAAVTAWRSSTAAIIALAQLGPCVWSPLASVLSLPGRLDARFIVHASTGAQWPLDAEQPY
jgi:hypothetical protein